MLLFLNNIKKCVRVPFFMPTDCIICVMLKINIILPVSLQGLLGGEYG